MRITIIPSDKCVYVDGKSFSALDLNQCQIPTNIHALQWDESFGEIEFSVNYVDGVIQKPQNEIIVELPDWANKALAVWNIANNENRI